MQLWDKLDGKKSVLGFALLFVYGGLVALGYDIPELKAASLWLIGVGAVHKIEKAAI